MAATILAKSGVTLLYGVDSTIAALSGYIMSDGDTDYLSDTATAEDSQGSLNAIAFFNQMVEIKFTSLVVSGTTLPLPGAIVTVSSVMYAVMKVTKKTTNKRFQIVTIDLKSWTDNVVPN